MLLRDGTEVSSWPLARSGRPDLALVDELARLQLAARRVGCSIRLYRPAPELTELLILTGLADIVSVDDGMAGPAGVTAAGGGEPVELCVDGLETARQPEGREKVGDEKVGDGGHPAG